MRLKQLSLTRYGKFTGFDLDFSAAPPPGGADLHVVHGPNEAGKTTVLSAWLDFLFQFPVRSQMNFLHANSALQLDAVVQFDGAEHGLTRVKKRDGSLLDTNGATVSEEILRRAMRGLDRPSYKAMFSLDRKTLEDGGESILASQGDLGALLFQASAGLTDLSGQLDALRSDSDRFLSPSGRSGELRTLRKQVDEISAQIRDLDTAASEFARLTRDRDERQAQWQAAARVREAAQGQLQTAERLLRALPFAHRLQRLDTEIAALPDLPEPPSGWMQEVPDLDRQETTLSLRVDTAHTAVLEAEQTLARLVPDHSMLDARDAFARVEALKSAFETANDDLPKRLAEQDVARADITALLARLGKDTTNPAELVPDVATSAQLQALIDAHSGVDQNLQTAVHEAESAQLSLDQERQHLRDAGAVDVEDGAGSGLGGLMRRVVREDPIAALQRARAAAADAEGRLRQKVEGLAPFVGSVSDLVGLTLPTTEQVQHLATRMEDAARVVDKSEAELARIDAELAVQGGDNTGETSIRDAGQGDLARQAARARTEREAAWQHHINDMTGDTAQRFEQAMRLDDQLVTTAARAAVRAEDLAERAPERARLAVRRSKALEHHAQVVAAAEAAEQELANLRRALSLPDDMSVSALTQWVSRAGDVRLAAQDTEQQQNVARWASEECDRVQQDLSLALIGCGQPVDTSAGLALLIEQALSFDARRQAVAARKDALQQAETNLRQRQDALRLAKKRMADWQSDWQAACARTRLASDPASPTQTLTVAELRALLQAVSPLSELLSRVADLGHRIDAMRSNQSAFGDAVMALARSLDMDESGSSDVEVIAIWHSLSKRVRQAEELDKQRRDTTQLLQSCRDGLTDIEQAFAQHQSRTRSFAEFFGAKDWPETRSLLQQAGQRADLLSDRRQCSEDLCTLTEATSEAVALEALAGAEADALQRQAAELAAEVARLATQQDAAHVALQEAERALRDVGGDDAVAVLEEQRASLLVEIEDRAHHHLKQRLGILSVERALRQYRDRHRSGMLTRASRTFSQITQGQYTELVTRPDGTRETLVAMVADGGSKTADQLSEGTRAQLFLALRIAGYHEFQANSGAVPFIADDIMESFDDARAVETFRQLAKMSEKGQVIYLTHHAHLRDLAREACAGVTIHEMSG